MGVDLEEMKMNISKYDFHDGYIIDIKYINKKIEIYMESAEIADDELEDDIILSEHDTIKGILHIERIRTAKMNDEEFLENFTKSYDEGIISSFNIKENKVTLVFSWINHPPTYYEETDFFTFEVEAETIFWENIPNLINPFW